MAILPANLTRTSIGTHPSFTGMCIIKTCITGMGTATLPKRRLGPEAFRRYWRQPFGRAWIEVSLVPCRPGDFESRRGEPISACGAFSPSIARRATVIFDPQATS